MSDEQNRKKLPFDKWGIYAYKNLDSEVVDCNELFLKYAGAKSLDNVVGKTDIDFPWGEYADYYRKHELDAFDGKVYSTILPGKDVSGREILIFITRTPWYNDKNKLIGSLGHAIEIINPQMLQLNHLLKKTDAVNTEQKYIIGKHSNGIKLTARESEVLFYLLRGKSAKETAKILGISSRTVEVHIDHLRFKFNCRSKQELFAQAIEKGYFNVIPESLFKAKLADELS